MGSSAKPVKPKKTDLEPIDWKAIEPHYKAGIRSIQTIAKEYGCSHVAILKHAKKVGWTRSLKAKITERAAQMVTESAVTGQVTKTPKAVEITEALAVEANAQALAMVQLAHRTMAAELRQLATQLLAECTANTMQPELFVRIRDLLETIEEPTVEQRQAMRDAMAAVANLPGRVKTLKDLVELMAKIVGMERENFGLNAQDGTGGDRYTLIVKDYTGRGDPDSPRAKERALEELQR